MCWEVVVGTERIVSGSECIESGPAVGRGEVGLGTCYAFENGMSAKREFLFVEYGLGVSP